MSPELTSWSNVGLCSFPLPIISLRDWSWVLILILNALTRSQGFLVHPLPFSFVSTHIFLLSSFWPQFVFEIPLWITYILEDYPSRQPNKCFRWSSFVISWSSLQRCQWHWGSVQFCLQLEAQLSALAGEGTLCILVSSALTSRLSEVQH